MHGDTSISLLKAIRNGDKDLARRILLARNFTDIDKQTSRRDGTALFWACCLGYTDLVHFLLLSGADVNMCTAWGATPLHACVDHNYVDIVTLLIRFGAKVNHQTSYGDTPCHLASYRGFFQCVKRLAEEGANINIRNNKRLTPLEEAYVNGHIDIYKYLVAVQQLVGSRSSKSACEESVQSTLFPLYTDTEQKLHQPQSYLPHPQYSVQPDMCSVRSETDGSFSVQDSVESSDDFRSISEVKESNVPGDKRIAGVLHLTPRTVCASGISSDFSGLSMNDLSASSSSVSSTASSDFSSSSLSSIHKMSFKNI